MDEDLSQKQPRRARNLVGSGSPLLLTRRPRRRESEIDEADGEVHRLVERRRLRIQHERVNAPDPLEPDLRRDIRAELANKRDSRVVPDGLARKRHTVETGVVVVAPAQREDRLRMAWTEPAKPGRAQHHGLGRLLPVLPRHEDVDERLGLAAQPLREDEGVVRAPPRGTQFRLGNLGHGGSTCRAPARRLRRGDGRDERGPVTGEVGDGGVEFGDRLLGLRDDALARAALLALLDDLSKRLRGRKLTQRRTCLGHAHSARHAARDRLVEVQLLAQVAHAGLLEPDRREDASEGRSDGLRGREHTLQCLRTHSSHYSEV